MPSLVGVPSGALIVPRGKSRRGWRGRKGGSSALHIQARIPIAERPAAAQDRSSPGHWEADLMMFARHGQAILALHERASRLLIAMPLNGKASAPIAAMIAGLLGPLPPQLRQTVTFDNGTEFARHHELHAHQIATFFCDPYAPWQKGGIENAIGRLRRSLPRKADLSLVTQNNFEATIRLYNNTPRKCLDWNTPSEIFWRHLLHFKCESTPPPSRG